jgi:hypothetical protein
MNARCREAFPSHSTLVLFLSAYTHAYKLYQSFAWQFIISKAEKREGNKTLAVFPNKHNINNCTSVSSRTGGITHMWKAWKECMVSPYILNMRELIVYTSLEEVWQ